MLLATKALPMSQAEQLCDKICHLEKLANIKVITDLLAIR